MSRQSFLSGSKKRHGDARVVELVDTLVLGTSAARCEGSSPFPRTILRTNFICIVSTCDVVTLWALFRAVSLKKPLFGEVAEWSKAAPC
jgi:hypothetical protein